MRPDCLLSLGLVGLFTALLLLAAPVQAQDQETDGLDLRWGVSAGAVSSAFQGDAEAFRGSFCPPTQYCVLIARPSPTFGGRQTGARFGISVEANLTEWLSTRAEVNYVQNGGVVQRQVTFDGGATELREVARYRINYLTVPLLAKVEVPGWKGSIRPSLFAGPTLGINVDWHSKSELEEFQTEPQFASFSSGIGPDPIQAGEVRPVMFSAVAGAEVDYRLPSGRAVALEVRYRRGLTAAVGRDVVDRATARTGAVSVGLRYVFSR